MMSGDKFLLFTNIHVLFNLSKQKTKQKENLLGFGDGK